MKNANPLIIKLIKELYIEKANQLLAESPLAPLTIAEIGIEPQIKRFAKKTVYFEPFIFNVNGVEHEIRISEGWLFTDSKIAFKDTEPNSETPKQIHLYHPERDPIDISESQMFRDLSKMMKERKQAA